MSMATWLQNNATFSNIVLAVGMAAGLVLGYRDLQHDNVKTAGDLAELKKTVGEFRTATDARFDTIARALEVLPNLSYRVTATEEGLKASNNRQDASLANVSERLAELNRSVGSLGTEIAVLRQRLDSDRPQRRAETTSPR